ncbi:hypothetical protein HMSSN139_62570 [Paenibacillus sp. HMSSN-139]|nr:hypothetical protein HMSSN139_62570 [Paenibacillus sp. HMSSN-139]
MGRFVQYAGSDGRRLPGDFQKTQDIIQKRIPEAILSKPDQFDSVYDDFLAELDRAGAEKMEKEYTALVKARVALFTGKEVK